MDKTDLDVMVELRSEVVDALTAAGWEVWGSGVGFGGCDVVFRRPGHDLVLTVQPRLPAPQSMN
jgi:hypothetical protein